MALQLNDKNPLVKKWQQFLNLQGFNCGEPSGNFDQKTFTATKNFQQYYNIQQTGEAGSITLGKAHQLGFNPEKEPGNDQIKSDKELLQWIKANLSGIMKQAVSGMPYTEDWLAGMCARETGFKIVSYINQGHDFNFICTNMKGDYGQRKGDPGPIYHGYGFWQIDIASYPDFVASGAWQDPLATAKQAVAVLNEKRNFLEYVEKQLSPIDFERAVTAAYNCGQGNVMKAIHNKSDFDCYTYHGDYSQEVFRYRGIYRML
ncbi:MAG: peptidoglycan-binding protein [Chitinophagales bacterium]|nr:peptidoglycan-binding protein [Chitinophagales bacterium]